MARAGRPETPIRYRFLEKIIFDEKRGCWHWGGARSRQGYGFIKRKDGVQLRAHRLAYELTHGPIPAGTFVCHRCDTPDCVRPSHLFLGSHQDNMDDMVRKGRAPRMSGIRNGAARLSPNDVTEIRRTGGPYRLLAERFGISPSAVGLIKRGERWACL